MIFNRSIKHKTIKTLKALILDIDGTLADTETSGHLIAFNRAFDDLGYAWIWPKGLYHDLLKISGSKERLEYFLKVIIEFNISDKQMEELISKLYERKNVHYKNLVEEGKVKIRAGIRNLIDDALKENITLAIATSSAKQNAVALLKSLFGNEYDKIFKVIATGETVENKKPAPDIYNFVLEKLNLSPDECLALEDSAHGLKAALGAGIKTAITFNEYTSDHNFAGASLVVESLEHGKKNVNLRVLKEVFLRKI